MRKRSKHWIKNKFKIYLPHNLKIPLIWFILSIVIGLIIQSVQTSQFRFVDFFYKNYFQWLTLLYAGIASSFFLGFGIILSYLFVYFYYIIFTISGIVIIFRLLADLGDRNTRKILIWILIALAGIFLFNYLYQSYGFYLNGSAKSTKYSGCPDFIIPDNISFKTDGMPEGLIISSNSFAKLNNIPPTVWKDGMGVLVYSTAPFTNEPLIDTYVGLSPITPVCVKGTQAGQNINYYYCDNLAYLKETTDISKEGVIGKTTRIEYEVSLVLKELEYHKANPWDTYADFEIVEARCAKR